MEDGAVGIWFLRRKKHEDGGDDSLTSETGKRRQLLGYSDLDLGLCEDEELWKRERRRENVLGRDV